MIVEYKSFEPKRLYFSDLKQKKLYQIVNTNNPALIGKICIRVNSGYEGSQLHVFHNEKTILDVFTPDHTMQFSELKSGERVVLIQE